MKLVTQTLNEFKVKLQTMYEMARETMGVRQKQALTYYDKKLKMTSFQPTPYVYVYIPRNRRLKMVLKWHGPFKVLKGNTPAIRN